MCRESREQTLGIRGEIVISSLLPFVLGDGAGAEPETCQRKRSSGDGLLEGRTWSRFGICLNRDTAVRSAEIALTDASSVRLALDISLQIPYTTYLNVNDLPHLREVEKLATWNFRFVAGIFLLTRLNEGLCDGFVLTKTAKKLLCVSIVLREGRTWTAVGGRLQEEARGTVSMTGRLDLAAGGDFGSSGGEVLENVPRASGRRRCAWSIQRTKSYKYCV